MKKTPNALVAAGRISDQTLPARWNQSAIMMYSGMMPSWVGTIMVATTSSSRPLRPLKRSLAKRSAHSNTPWRWITHIRESALNYGQKNVSAAPSRQVPGGQKPGSGTRESALMQP
jgi:hypothetical protein